MKVHVLQVSWQYGCCRPDYEIEGVFTTEEQAEARGKELLKKGAHEYTVDDYELTED
jgi:hypothetical protein